MKQIIQCLNGRSSKDKHYYSMAVVLRMKRMALFRLS